LFAPISLTLPTLASVRLSASLSMPTLASSREKAIGMTKLSPNGFQISIDLVTRSERMSMPQPR
jgi:hypothetical protein